MEREHYKAKCALMVSRCRSIIKPKFDLRVRLAVGIDGFVLLVQKRCLEVHWVANKFPAMVVPRIVLTQNLSGIREKHLSTAPGSPSSGVPVKAFDCRSGEDGEIMRAWELKSR